MNLGIVHHHLEVQEGARGVGAVQGLEQVQEEPRGFAVPHTVGNGAGGDIERPGQVAFLIRARRHHLHLLPFGHPLRADLGQQTEVQLVGKEQRHARPHLLKSVTNPCQFLHPLGIVILGASLARFHTQPSSCRPRRTVSPDTTTPCRAWSSKAIVAQLHRVRPHPPRRGTLCRIAPSGPLEHGREPRQAPERALRVALPLPAASPANCPARYALTTR